MLIDDPQKSIFGTQRKINSGGGGLLSTATDYMRFCRMMLNKGELDGVRLLGRKTVELMTTNHLRGDMAEMGQPRFSESSYYGIGFGLGFSVMLDPAKAQILGSPGEYAWGGAAQHRVLDRSGRGHGGDHADAAHAVLDLSDPPRAARADVSGDCGLMRNTGPITVTRLHPLFGAEVSGIDITRPLSAREFRPIRAAFEEHSVLLFRDQPMDDAKPDRVQRAVRTARDHRQLQSRRRHQVPAPVQPRHHDGQPIPPDDMRMIYQKANYFWHSDSSFKRVPYALCSILTARLCPPEGGNTEFLCMRAAWDALPAALKATIGPLIAEHALLYSRNRVQKGILSAQAIAELPPVKQRLYRDNPINGRRSLYIGAHAGRIVDWPRATGEALLFELSQRAEQPEFRLSHAWREGDVIVWDNRAVLHRATYYDTVKYNAHAAHHHRRRSADGAAIRIAEAPRHRTSPPDGMPAGWPRRLAVATITIGLMMSVLSNSMTNLALPYIAHDLNITAESSIWIVNATQIALIISLLPVAALADIVGYRHVYRYGLVLFSLASVACALAPTLPWLLAGRTFQGLGGAAIMAIQPALVRAIYPRNELGRGLGFNTTVVATSLAAGPSLGAALLSITSWPILFAVYAPLGIISFVLSERTVRTPRTQGARSTCCRRSFPAPPSMLIFGIDGMAHGHHRLVVVSELALAAAFGTLFVWRQSASPTR